MRLLPPRPRAGGRRHGTALAALAILAASACAGNTGREGDPATEAATATPPALSAGTSGLRLALLDDLVEKTLRREAFSQKKNAALGLDFARDAGALREEFRAAETPEALRRALVHLSNLRRDGHLSVLPVEGGLPFPEDAPRHAPVRFAIDFSDPDAPFPFVSDVADAALDAALPPEGRRPAPGDRLLGIRSPGSPEPRLPVEHLRSVARELTASTDARLWLEFGAHLNVLRADWPEEAFAREPDGKCDPAPCVSYVLQGADGKRYTVRLPFLPTEQIAWRHSPHPLARPPHQAPLDFLHAAAGRGRDFPGYRAVRARDSYTLHLPEGDADGPLLLEWHHFTGNVRADVQDLIRHASARDLLQRDVILDLSQARGGKKGWYLLRHLVQRPFGVTSGNVRISDITPDLAGRLESRTDPETPEGRRLLAWLGGELAQAMERGDPFSAPVPFKLRATPLTDGNLLQPAPVRFSGRLVLLTGPLGRSQVDQVAAMVADGGLGPIIGMATAGSSNTWEWLEPVGFPGAPPLALFMWSVGQTLRPDGEVLEGNPPEPTDFVPLTRKNHAAYDALLLERARARLSREAGSTTR